MSTVDRPPAPYEQVARQVRSEIQRGRLAPGTGLPSVQRLAQQWDVAPATVGRALGLLRDEGWIVTRPAKPAVVTESPPGGMGWFALSGP